MSAPISSPRTVLGTATLLTPAEITMLIGLRYPDGQFIVTLNGDASNREVLLEVTQMLQTSGFDATVKYLSTASTADMILRNLPSLEPQRRIEKVESDILRGDMRITVGPPCKYCASSNTNFIIIQMRGMDEPADVYYQCNEPESICGKRWR